MQKANFGEVGTRIKFQWDQDAHLFTGQKLGSASPSERAHQEHEEQRGILDSLRASESGDVVVPAATTGRRTAYHVLSAHPVFPESLRTGKYAVRRFWRHIEVLRQRGQIGEATHRRHDGHRMNKLIAHGESVNAK